MYYLILPYPPSVNSTQSSIDEYRKEVYACWLRAGCPRLYDAESWVRITVYPPDRRKRDLDNILKRLLDALEGLLFDDDSAISILIVVRAYQARRGFVMIEARALSLSEKNAQTMLGMGQAWQQGEVDYD